MYIVERLQTYNLKRRYADQCWLIYDLRRKQAIHYDKVSELVTEVALEWKEAGSSRPAPDALATHEALYQALWKDYFKSTGIAARRNPRLHLRHMPLRYWRYLTEKGS